MKDNDPMADFALNGSPTGEILYGILIFYGLFIYNQDGMMHLMN